MTPLTARINSSHVELQSHARGDKHQVQVEQNSGCGRPEYKTIVRQTNHESHTPYCVEAKHFEAP